MPSSLIIPEHKVNMVEANCPWSGEHSDVFRGTYKQYAVAIKSYRLLGHEITTFGDVCTPPRCKSYLAHDAG
jgi:hypothetical protein